MVNFTQVSLVLHNKIELYGIKKEPITSMYLKIAQIQKGRPKLV